MQSIKLDGDAKKSAKIIFDALYKYDKFEKIIKLFQIKTNIKIDTSEFGASDYLRYVFITSNSDMYNNKNRTYITTDYVFQVNSQTVTCRLTTQWYGFDNGLGNKIGDGNYLNAVMQLVNKYYSGKFYIKLKNGAYNLIDINFSEELNTFLQFGNSTFAKRYIKSLLAKPFVILSGNSGTGKTKIAKDFAYWLEKSFANSPNDTNVLLLPVGADWTDNTKILGYYNPMNDKYEKTKVLELIERANENPDVPFFLILDEMNLSHVERYFSDFLSLMETPDETIKMDGKTSLKFPQNLFVTGTVNIDETTYMFSPKVLDRANVIEFKLEKDSVLAVMKNDSDSNEIKRAEDGIAEAFMQLAKNVRNSKVADYYDKINFDATIQVLDSLYDHLSKADFEFAFRTVKEIRLYLIASYELEFDKEKFKLDDCLDEQIVQKVLPKIHGNKKQIGDLLDNLEKICIEKPFPLSKAKIIKMKERLSAQQYTSFI